MHKVNEDILRVCLLERDAANHIEKIAMKDCLAQVLRQCHVPDGSGSMLAVFRLIQQLAAVRLYRLGCNQEDEAAQTSYNAMVK